MKRGRGRPAKPKQVHQNVPVRVFLTPQQAEKLSSRAAAAGLPVSTYIRQVLKIK
jgi:predicted DNA binding CopG/RHH family protein